MKLLEKCLLVYISIIFTGCAVIQKTDLHQEVQKTSGKLKVDTVWQGLIEVEDKIIVPEGITLTIKPGTIIRFQKKGFKQYGFGDNRVYIQKGGKLVASGNPENFITFTSAERKPEPGDWHGLEFHSEDDLSILEYCKVEYAYEGIASILSSPGISNCIISKNDKGLCFWQKSGPMINKNKITNNNTGILCSSRSEPNITSNIITYNKDSGINCEKGSSVNILKNDINNNYIGIKMNLNVTANVDENIIRNNEYGIQLLTVAAAIIKRNIIEENKYGIYSLKKSFVNIKNNTFSKNEYGVFSWERTQGEIKHNKITKNNFGIYCGKSSHAEITGNNIIKNMTGILCEFSSYPRINGNNIYDQKEFDIKLGEKQSAEWTRNIWDAVEINKWEERGRFGLIDATGNYWGGSTTKEIDEKGFESHIKKIYDYYKDKFISVDGKKYERDKVDFRNWAKSEIN